MKSTCIDPQSDVCAAIDRRVRALQLLTREQLEAMPSESTDVQTIAGIKVEFTTYVGRRLDEGLIVLVRSDQRRLMGLVRAGNTYGFLVLPDGTRRSATVEDVCDEFG